MDEHFNNFKENINYIEKLDNDDKENIYIKDNNHVINYYNYYNDNYKRRIITGDINDKFIEYEKLLNNMNIDEKIKLKAINYSEQDVNNEHEIIVKIFNDEKNYVTFINLIKDYLTKFECINYNIYNFYLYDYLINNINIDKNNLSINNKNNIKNIIDEYMISLNYLNEDDIKNDSIKKKPEIENINELILYLHNNIIKQENDNNQNMIVIKNYLNEKKYKYFISVKEYAVKLLQFYINIKIQKNIITQNININNFKLNINSYNKNKKKLFIKIYILNIVIIIYDIIKLTEYFSMKSDNIDDNIKDILKEVNKQMLKEDRL